jgi:hypothetical protein
MIILRSYKLTMILQLSQNDFTTILRKSSNFFGTKSYLDVKVSPLVICLDHVAPVEKVIVVDHPAAEVGLKKKEKLNKLKVLESVLFVANSNMIRDDPR